MRSSIGDGRNSPEVEALRKVGLAGWLPAVPRTARRLKAPAQRACDSRPDEVDDLVEALEDAVGSPWDLGELGRELEDRIVAMNGAGTPNDAGGHLAPGWKRGIPAMA